MKKYLLAATAALICSFSAVTSHGQTATFSFNDGTGVPNAGTYFRGNTFTLSIMLTFVPGGTVPNIEGLSYWFEQQNPSAPFNFSITNRDLTGSAFSVPQSPGIIYPQPLTPQSASDLGATLPGLTGMPGGSYFIANVTFTISATAANGTYIIEDTTTGGKTSVVSDDQGHTFGIARSLYTITIVPETGSTALLLGLGVAGLILLGRRRQRA